MTGSSADGAELTLAWPRARSAPAHVRTLSYGAGEVTDDAGNAAARDRRSRADDGAGPVMTGGPHARTATATGGSTR